jgi:streptogramin lyase
MDMQHPLTRLRVVFALGLGAIVALAPLALPAPAAAQQTITEYAVPTASSGPGAVVPGPDGALWFAEVSGNKIGRRTPDGVVTNEFIVPTGSSPFGPLGMVAGPDGALWFAQVSANKIGRITTAGVVSEFTIPTNSGDPNGIAVGSDGALWFTEFFGNQIGRITTAGVITEFAIPTANSGPWGIAAGPDGALWFTEQNGNNIGRITTAGVITELAIPTGNSQPYGIAAGAGRRAVVHRAERQQDRSRIGGHHRSRRAHGEQRTH